MTLAPNPGIPREGRTSLTMWMGNDEMSTGRYRFRRVNGQWHVNIGLGNWARSRKPLTGDKVGSVFDGRSGKMVYYGDPNIYRLTWTEYEEVGNLDDTFFVVFESAKETQWYEMAASWRAAFDSAPDKLAWINVSTPQRSVRYLSGGSHVGAHDRSRDNPACVIYIPDLAPKP